MFPSKSLLLLLLFFSPRLIAEESAVPKEEVIPSLLDVQVQGIEPDPGILKWQDGWALFGGIGFTAGVFVSNQDRTRGVIGPSIATALGYCMRGTFCMDLGSVVNFNRYNDLRGAREGVNLEADVQMWETTFYFSTKNKLPTQFPSNYWNPWISLMLGIGNSVGFLSEINDVDIDKTVEFYPYEDMRFHAQGPLLGMSFLFLFNAYNNAPMWFIEIGTSVLIHWKTYMVSPAEELPIVIDQFTPDSKQHVTRLHLNVGMRLF